MHLEISIWIDEDRETSVKVASAALIDSKQYEGHSGLSVPLEYVLPSGLLLTINCERVPTGNFNIGIAYGGELQMMLGVYSDRFVLRVFPPGHSSFVIKLGPPEARAG
jgi:hypothetical protein